MAQIGEQNTKLESINVSFIKLIALFNDMRTMKFKAKLTITFYGQSLS